MSHRFSRTELCIGAVGLQSLAQKSVAVVGLGGVGSYTAEALARSGVGRIVLVDKDVIDITNINRQLPALTSTIGQPKVDVMAARIRDINPDCEVIAKRIFFLEETQDMLFSDTLDYVADAIDTITAKIHLVVACRQRGIPIVSSMGAANKLDPSGFRVMDLSETSVDPIARIMRRELKKHGIEQGLTVVCSTEPPRAPWVNPENSTKSPVAASESLPTLPRKVTQPPASMAFVPPVAGLLMASAIIRDLLQI